MAERLTDNTEEGGDVMRYDRQLKFFGSKGQKKISEAKVAIMGLGGLGSHVAQQLAYLGIQNFYLVDGDTIQDHNLNRLIGATPKNIGASKVETIANFIHDIDPNATVNIKKEFLPCEDLSEFIDQVDIIFGAFDNDYARLKALEIASMKQKIYIDAASGIRNIGSDLVYGGRLIVCGEERGCLYCLDELDQRDIRIAQMTDEELKGEAEIYGIPLKDLKAKSPSVVTLNGVVASLATTEAMVYITGLRKTNKFLEYRGEELNNFFNRSVVRKINRKMNSACAYCYQWGVLEGGS